jgi:hypothetical protein
MVQKIMFEDFGNCSFILIGFILINEIILMTNLMEYKTAV